MIRRGHTAHGNGEIAEFAENAEKCLDKILAGFATLCGLSVNALLPV
jgi:hypothetical protein